MSSQNNMYSGLERELELYMGEEHEDGGPTIEPQKILAKVDYINDSRLTNKPGKTVPVEILFLFGYDKYRSIVIIDIVFKRLDTNYTYDIAKFWRLKCNLTGSRIEGDTHPDPVAGHLLFEITDTDKSKPASLTYRIFSSTPSPAIGGGSGHKFKDDRYIIEQGEVQKIKNIFVKLLKDGHITLLPIGTGEKEFESGDNEFELDDSGEDFGFAYESEYEDDDEYDDGDEFDDVEENDKYAFEFEFDEDEEYGLENELNLLEDNGVTKDFSRRLYEMSTRSFESEFEIEMELDRALNAVENEFMVKRLSRKRKKGKRKGLFKKILSTGAKIVGKVAGKTPIGSLIKAGTSLVRGNVKGALGNLAKAAVGTALGPVAGTVATTAIDALGGGEEGEISRGGRRRQAIRRVARIARDTYREVADTLPDDFDHPLVANEVARKAVSKAMIKNGVRPPGRAGDMPKKRRVIHLKPGEKLVIVRP